MARIVVLDDVYDAGVLLKRLLQRLGHQVDVFTEEGEAISYVQEELPDLAILDIKLKSQSGIEVLAVMKQAHPQLKAIMLTGYPTARTARDAARLGAGGYCVKPIDKEELEQKVTKILADK